MLLSILLWNLRITKLLTLVLFSFNLNSTMDSHEPLADRIHSMSYAEGILVVNVDHRSM